MPVDPDTQEDHLSTDIPYRPGSHREITALKIYYLILTQRATIKYRNIAYADEDMENMELLYITDENVNWYCHFKKRIWRLLKN